MDFLKQLERDLRVTMRRAAPPDPDGSCVVYWMRRTLRAVDNPSLETAIKAANALRKPVVVFFRLVPVANANLRHYTFLVQGLPEIRDTLSLKNVGFVLRAYPEDIPGFCREVRAALVVTDESPLRGPERHLQLVIRELRIPLLSVDSDVVVPSKCIPGKQYAARTIRPKLLRVRDEFLRRTRSLTPVVSWGKKLKSLPCDESCLESINIDRSVQPSTEIRGGTAEAHRGLRNFLTQKLSRYDEQRNHPEVFGTSGLSPYLHFGQISPVTAAVEVMQSAAPNSAKEAFLDQLITWRELSINFVRYNPLYDTVECAEPWAQRTLAKHAKDKREVIYSSQQLENAETHDALWNAAQMQMVELGWMHNYMRMYWGKKILEWTRSAAEAFHIAVRLNDRYEIDGREPNGYAGIAWSIVGKFDRAWPERPVFGQIRYMSLASTGRKFNSKKYIAQNSPRDNGEFRLSG